LFFTALHRLSPIADFYTELPGDIAYEKGNVRFYFPIVTCIVISVVLSLIFYVVRLFNK